MKTNNKVKRVVAVYLAVLLVLTVIAAIGVSAKVYTWNHRVELSSGAIYTIGTSMGGTGRMSDTFQAYPDVYGSYTSSANRARAYNYSKGIYYSWVQFTLYEASGAPNTVAYGNSLTTGNYEIRYENTGQGGFGADSILSRTY